MSGIEVNNEELQRWLADNFAREQEAKKRDEFVTKICNEGYAGFTPQVVKELWDKGSLKEKVNAYGINERNVMTILMDAAKEEKLKIELEEAKKAQSAQVAEPQPINNNINYQNNVHVDSKDKMDEVFDGYSFDPLTDDKLSNLNIGEKIMLKMAFGG